MNEEAWPRLLRQEFPRARLCNCGRAWQKDEEEGGCGYAQIEAEERVARKLLRKVREVDRV